VRILHFFKTYYPDGHGGIEEVIRQLVVGGRALGLESEVLTLTEGLSGEINFEGHRVHRVKRLFKLASTDFSFRALSRFKKLARRADLIHYHFPWPLADLAHFYAGHGKPTILSYHSDIVAQKKLLHLYRPLMNKFLSRVNAIVAASPNYLQSSPVLQSQGARVRCIPYGLTEIPPPDQARQAFWRSRLGDRFFLFIGVFRYYKGLPYLLEAVREQPYPLVLIGEGGQEKELKAQAGRANLTNVHFLGALSDEDKAALLSLCRGLILPSHLRSEAFGLSLVEGAMFGKPLISCEIATGTTYINQDEVSGLVVPPADIPALRAALGRLWADDQLVAKLGAGARQRYGDLFTAEKMVKSYVALYSELLGQV
jgi:rhamnosyl/mannosyltransferase